MSRAAQYIAGEWSEGEGLSFVSKNPVDGGSKLWKAKAASATQVDAAVQAAQAAQKAWAALSLDQRIDALKAYQEVTRRHADAFARLISQETGKPLWESQGEVKAVVGKVDLSIQSQKERCGERVKELSMAVSALRHRPHGVLAVFGPFNFPAHLPNGHIVPALLAGNCVVLKPSEVTPAVAEQMVKLWEEAGLPSGVLNLVQGARETGEVLAQHPGLNGLLFTGSSQTGSHLHELFGAHPEKILALEMGGNNPLVVWDVKDPQAAAYLTVQSAFITSGQRCTCARRLILPDDARGDEVLQELEGWLNGLHMGSYDEDPQPYMGPLVSAQSVDRVQAAQEKLAAAGGRWLVRAERPDPTGAFLSPGVMDVSSIGSPPDEEIFGPFLQVYRVSRFEDALRVANATRYGLAAGLLSDKTDHWRRFFSSVRAGIVNWNTQLTGASSAAPFGGVGLSGNHRPSAYYAADYCNYPVASMELDQLRMPKSLAPGMDREANAQQG